MNSSKLTGFHELAELTKGPLFQLPGPLASHPQVFPDSRESLRLFAVESKAETKDRGLAFFQLIQGLASPGEVFPPAQFMVRRQGAVIGQCFVGRPTARFRLRQSSQIHNLEGLLHKLELSTREL